VFSNHINGRQPGFAGLKKSPHIQASVSHLPPGRLRKPLVAVADLRDIRRIPLGMIPLTSSFGANRDRPGA
jgi:hypothetical protein